MNNFSITSLVSYFDSPYLDHPVEILQGELLRVIQNGGQEVRLRSTLSSGGSMKGADM